MVNYYKLLEISQDADQGTIELAIKKMRRIWNNRANNPDSTIRAEAEKRVREIAEAEKILLDRAKRNEYDVQLSQNAESDKPLSASESEGDWEEEFFKAYDNNMNDYAAQIAQKEIRAQERNGKAWFLYGEALRRDGKIPQSIDALRRASLLWENHSEVYRQLGIAFLDSKQIDEACNAFLKGAKISPEDPEFHARAANCYRKMERLNDSIREAKIAYELDSNDNDIRFEYFAALYESVLSAMSYNRNSGKHLITNVKQLMYANDSLKTMSVVIPKGDKELESLMEGIVQIVVDAETPKKAGIFSPSKPGYEYNYGISSAETRASGIH